MRFNSLGNAVGGTAAGTVWIDGVDVACLVGHTAAVTTGAAWIDTDDFALQTNIFVPLGLTKVKVSTNTATSIDSLGTSKVAAGNGVVAAFLQDGVSGVRWPLGGPATHPLGALGDVSPQGLSAIIQNYSAGTGVLTFAAGGSQLSSTSVTLAAGSEIRAKDGIFAYRDAVGTHLRSLTNGTLQSYAPRTGDITFQCIPITVSGQTWVVEAVGAGVSTLSIRPTTSSNGFILATGDTFSVDAVVVGSEVWIGWSTTSGELKTNLRIAALTVGTGGLRTGTTASGSLVFTTQSPLTQSAFTIGPVEGGGTRNAALQPRYALKDDAFVGGGDGKRIYQKWWDQTATQAAAPPNLSQGTGTVDPAHGGTGTTTGLTVLDGQNIIAASEPLSALQSQPASTLVGRDSGSAGSPEVITLGTNLSMAGTVLNATGGGGSVGINGAPGIDGEDGVDGPPGVPGAAGGAGAPGSIGPMGPFGVPGLDGDDGADGPPGAQGAAGAAGTPGSIGPMGPWGAPGLDGDDGMDGPPGPMGPQGPAGGGGGAGTPTFAFFMGM